MPDLSSLADDDDTGRIRTEVGKGPPSDPALAVSALAAAFIVHEAQDTRRHRQQLGALGLIATAALAIAAWAWTVQADSGAERARLEDVQRRLDRIEQQIDRLVERSEDR